MEICCCFVLLTSRAAPSLVPCQAGGLPKGSVEFSLLSGGTHIRPHCGPSNHRWRMHLGLVIPQEERASIRVGGLGGGGGGGGGGGDGGGGGGRRAWQEVCDLRPAHPLFHPAPAPGGYPTPNPCPDGGRRETQGKVLLFDDSFEHEVFHDGEGARVVLIVDAPSPRRDDRDRNSGLTAIYLLRFERPMLIVNLMTRSRYGTRSSLMRVSERKCAATSGGTRVRWRRDDPSTDGRAQRRRRRCVGVQLMICLWIYTQSYYIA
jgi:hypothetical protein